MALLVCVTMADSWEILKLLADSTRVRILTLLAKEELSVAELQEVLDMGQSRISSHLSLLRQGELVHDRREGKKTFYGLNITPDVTVFIAPGSCLPCRREYGSNR